MIPSGASWRAFFLADFNDRPMEQWRSASPCLRRGRSSCKARPICNTGGLFRGPSPRIRPGTVSGSATGKRVARQCVFTGSEASETGVAITNSFARKWLKPSRLRRRWMTDPGT